MFPTLASLENALMYFCARRKGDERGKKEGSREEGREGGREEVTIHL